MLLVVAVDVVAVVVVSVAAVVVAVVAGVAPSAASGFCFYFGGLFPSLFLYCRPNISPCLMLRTCAHNRSVDVWVFVRMRL